MTNFILSDVVSIPLASESASGLLSNNDKAKLNGISSSAQPNPAHISIDEINNPVETENRSFSPLDLNTFITKNSPSFTNVKAFGAKGDGVSRPLSTLFATLTDAQNVYPTAATLTDELDGVATQKALNYLRDHGGGTLFSPRGTYICNTTILIPTCNTFDTTIDNNVNWCGEYGGTKYKWNADLGSNAKAVSPADSADGDIGTKHEGFIRDLRFVGPNETFTLGIAPCLMKGCAFGASRKVQNVMISYFYGNLVILGDHTRFENVRAHYGYYNCYYENPYTNLNGDFILDKCAFNMATMAAIGIHYKAAAQGTFNGCYIGGSPYGIFKEKGISGNNVISFGNSEFNNCIFEFCGNALLSDSDEASGSAPWNSIKAVYMRHCYFSWDATKKIAANPAGAVMNAGTASRIFIEDPKEYSGWTPGTRGIFDFVLVIGMHIQGEVYQLGLNATAGNVHVFYYRSDDGHTSVTFQQVGSDFSATGRLLWCTGAVAVGNAMRLSNTIAVLASDLTAGPFAGIAITPIISGTQYLFVADTGHYIRATLDATLDSTRRNLKLSTVAGQFTSAQDRHDGEVVAFQIKGSGNTARVTLLPTIVNGEHTRTIYTVTGTSYTLTTTLLQRGYLRCTASGEVTITIPTNATATIPIGAEWSIRSAGVGGITISPTSGVTLNGTVTISQNTTRRLTKIGTDEWDIT